MVPTQDTEQFNERDTLKENKNGKRMQQNSKINIKRDLIFEE